MILVPESDDDNLFVPCAVGRRRRREGFLLFWWLSRCQFCFPVLGMCRFVKDFSVFGVFFDEFPLGIHRLTWRVRLFFSADRTRYIP